MTEPDKIEAASVREFLKKAFAPAISETEDMIKKQDESSAAVPMPEPLGLFAETHWLVSKAQGFPAFFTALIELVPPDSVLQIDGNPCPDVGEGLRPWLKEPSKKTGRFWRTLAKYIVPVTPENMAVLARLAENHAEPEVASQFLVLIRDEQILAWHDAPSDPIYVSGLMEEMKVARFAKHLGASITKETGSTSA